MGGWSGCGIISIPRSVFEEFFNRVNVPGGVDIVLDDDVVPSSYFFPKLGGYLSRLY